MFLSPKLLLTGLAIGGVAFFAMSGGGDEPSKPTRDPFTKPIAAPTDNELVAVKQVMCACFRGGATTRDELVVCSLRQVYGTDDDWATLLETVEGDTAGLAEVTGLFRRLAADLLRQPTDNAVDRWCSGNEPVEPEKPDPEKPEPEKPDPEKPDPEKPDVDVPDEWRALNSGTPYPGSFYAITQGDNGIEALARETLVGVGIESPSYKNLVLPLSAALSRGPRWNRKLYARTSKPKTPNNASEAPWSFDGKIIKPAWLPRNQNANARILQGERVERNIASDGDKIGSGTSLGTVWIPLFDIDVAVNDGVLVIKAADYDPPAEFLDAIGM